MHVVFATNKIAEPGPLPVGTEDKRAFPRHSALDISEIITGKGQAGFSCMVHDISEQGARLEVTCGELPERFLLANHVKRTRTLCRVMWRKGNFLGVKFLSRPRPFALHEGAGQS